MKYLNVPAEYKSAGDAGTFSGYASIFGNVDLGGDIVERGAFKDIVTNTAGKVIVLWQHMTRQPIGVADVKQDDKGLSFEGHLVMEDPQARTANAHMKAGSLQGMSIGYDVLPGGAEIKESGIRLLKALKLYEISAVTFGMNPLAKIEEAKSAGLITSEREFEEHLRDAGFSRAAAKSLASGGWKALQRQRDAGGDASVKELIDAAGGLAAFEISKF
jgi:HK97 family phage prohead protease